MPSCLTAPVLDERFPLPGAAPVAPLEVTEGDRESLLTALGRVPDPRDPRGVRYPLVAMLTVVVCGLIIEKTRRLAHGFRTFDHYRLRLSLIHISEPTRR